MASDQSVVFGSYPYGEGDHFVFLRETTAHDLRQLSHALNAALAWADFWVLLPDDERDDLRANLRRHDLELPTNDTPFDKPLLPGLDDGDYPTYAPAYGTDWMQIAIATRYGVRVDSFVSGTWTEYPTQHEDSIIAEVEKLGYVVYRDDDLITEARGL